MAKLYGHDASKYDIRTYSTAKILTKNLVSVGKTAVNSLMTNNILVKLETKMVGKTILIPLNSLLLYLEKEIDVVECAKLQIS